MEFKYLYIDDDKNAGDAIDLFSYESGEDKLIVEFKECLAKWDEQQAWLGSHSFNGILVDFNLNDQRESVEKAMYSGTEIAQRLRTGDEEKSCPIVLYSANANLNFWIDNKRSDLFDLVIGKDWTNKESYAIKLYSMAKAYKTIQDKGEDILKKMFAVDDLKLINKSFIDYMRKIIKEPTYVIAQFVLNELICKQGILINEDVLAARLGIDIEKSTDWENLKAQFDFAKYQGVFCEGWPRWWMFKMEEWWNNDIPNDEFWDSIPASERVRLLKEKYNLVNIVSAQPLAKADSEKFWTICKGYKKPLDSIDGLMIQGQENLFPWQEPEYVSYEAALTRKNKKEWKEIADIEETHFDKIKKYYESTQE